MNSEESYFRTFNLDPDPEIRKLLDAISGKLGNPGLPLPEHIPLREKKKLRIEMIHATMQLEGIGTSLETTTKIINRMNVRGLQNRIMDVLNIKKVYNQLKTFNPMSGASLVSAHTIMMAGRTAVSYTHLTLPTN